MAVLAVYLAFVSVSISQFSGKLQGNSAIIGVERAMACGIGGSYHGLAGQFPTLANRE